MILKLCHGSKFCFLNVHVQYMSKLCCKFQFPASITVEGDAETRTVLWCGMVQNIYMFPYLPMR